MLQEDGEERCVGELGQSRNLDKVKAATEVARSKRSPSLHRQEQKLARLGGEIDYVIFLPEGNQDVGVCLQHHVGKRTFTLLRQEALNSPMAVLKMYEMLAESNPAMKQVIRTQLQAEYGVDPLSEAAQEPNANVSEATLQSLLTSSIDDNVNSAMAAIGIEDTSKPESVILGAGTSNELQ
jgi:hypothetical protein